MFEYHGLEFSAVAFIVCAFGAECFHIILLFFFTRAGLVVVWLVGWLGGWMDGWLVGWMVGWMVGWLVGWLVGSWLTLSVPFRILETFRNFGGVWTIFGNAQSGCCFGPSQEESWGLVLKWKPTGKPTKN